ncbi:DUF397 domain-containing protein [Actinosynnema sp. NPDC050436]|uniref:DUF397 domain-containing protein n=1 Tax=Actinosynnema sp. NPDC050436 TaxID=3155659 RepID=UPI0033CE6B1C
MFRKSSYSGSNGNNCVEVARSVGVVGVRDSKAPVSAVRFAPAGFGRFVAGVKSGSAGVPVG